MDENANLWEELSSIEDGVMEEFANDPKNYGKRGSAYNPSVHVICQLDDIDDLVSVGVELAEIQQIVLILKAMGWELDGPSMDGVINTYWNGEGEAPPEFSSYIEKDGVLQNVLGEVLDDDDEE